MRTRAPEYVTEYANTDLYSIPHAKCVRVYARTYRYVRARIQTRIRVVCANTHIYA